MCDSFQFFPIHYNVFATRDQLRPLLASVANLSSIQPVDAIDYFMSVSRYWLPLSVSWVALALLLLLVCNNVLRISRACFAFLGLFCGVVLIFSFFFIWDALSGLSSLVCDLHADVDHLLWSANQSILSLSACDGFEEIEIDTVKDATDSFFNQVSLHPNRVQFSLAFMAFPISAMLVIVVSRIVDTPLKLSFGCFQVGSWAVASFALLVAVGLIQTIDVVDYVATNATSVLGSKVCVQSEVEVCNMLESCMQNPASLVLPFLLGYDDVVDFLKKDSRVSEFFPNVTNAQLQVVASILQSDAGVATISAISGDLETNLSSAYLLEVIDNEILPNVEILTGEPDGISEWINNSRVSLERDDALSPEEIEDIFLSNRPESLMNTTLKEVFPFVDFSFLDDSLNSVRRLSEKSCGISVVSKAINAFNCSLVFSTVQTITENESANSFAFHAFALFALTIGNFVWMGTLLRMRVDCEKVACDTATPVTKRVRRVRLRWQDYLR